MRVDWQRVLAAAAACLLFLPAGAGVAQTVLQPADPGFNRDRFDVQAEIRDHIVNALPAAWWATDPVRYLNGFQVFVHISDLWEGNPTTAMMTLCPDRRSPIWQETQSIRLQPVYRDLPWAGYECLP